MAHNSKNGFIKFDYQMYDGRLSVRERGILTS